MARLINKSLKEDDDVSEIVICGLIVWWNVLKGTEGCELRIDEVMIRTRLDVAHAGRKAALTTGLKDASASSYSLQLSEAA